MSQFQQLLSNRTSRVWVCPRVESAFAVAVAYSSFLSSREAFSTSLVTSSTLSAFSSSEAAPFPLGVASPEEDFLPSFSLASSASIFSISFLAFSMFCGR